MTLQCPTGTSTLPPPGLWRCTPTASCHHATFASDALQAYRTAELQGVYVHACFAGPGSIRAVSGRAWAVWAGLGLLHF